MLHLVSRFAANCFRRTLLTECAQLEHVSKSFFCQPPSIGIANSAVSFSSGIINQSNAGAPLEANDVNVDKSSGIINQSDVAAPVELNDINVDKYPIFTTINYTEIAGNDTKLLEKLEAVLIAMRSMARHHENLPSKLQPKQWEELLELRSYSGRRSFLRFLFIKEIKKMNEQKRKEKRRRLRQEHLNQIGPLPYKTDFLTYGLSGNSLFLRVYETTIDNLSNFKAFQGMMFGPKLIIDCSYEEYMIAPEMKSCVKQIIFLFSHNRLRQAPIDIHFVNLNPESKLGKRLELMLPRIFQPHYPFNWTPHSYLDFYPKEKLVYLTPHCEESLETISHDDIYIIGAMVDKSISEPLSLNKAKKSGIRYAKLPLDHYVDWRGGTKSLTVDQCGNIVTDTLLNNSWEESIKKWVPDRKIKPVTAEIVAAGLPERLKKCSVHNIRKSQKQNPKLYEYIMAELEEGQGSTDQDIRPQ